MVVPRDEKNPMEYDGLWSRLSHPTEIQGVWSRMGVGGRGEGGRATRISTYFLKLTVQQRFLNLLQDGRVSDSYPMIAQPTPSGRRVKKQLKSHLLLVNFYFVLAKFHIKRAHFPFVFPTQVQFLTQIIVIIFEPIQQPNVLSYLKTFAHKCLA